MITDADSTLGVEASQETFPETFPEMCEGSVKKLRAIYKETLPAKLVPSNGLFLRTGLNYRCSAATF